MFLVAVDATVQADGPRGGAYGVQGGSSFLFLLLGFALCLAPGVPPAVSICDGSNSMHHSHSFWSIQIPGIRQEVNLQQRADCSVHSNRILDFLPNSVSITQKYSGPFVVECWLDCFWISLVFCKWNRLFQYSLQGYIAPTQQ